MIFKIDSTKFNLIRKRAIISVLKFEIPSILFTLLIFYFLRGGQENLKFFVLISLSFIPLMILRQYFGFRNFYKELEPYEIVLTEKGIEQKFNSKKLKEIEWRDMRYEINNKGILTIHNKKISKLTGKLTGKGQIVIPSEIEDKQILIEEIKKHFD